MVFMSSENIDVFEMTDNDEVDKCYTNGDMETLTNNSLCKLSI